MFYHAPSSSRVLGEQQAYYKETTGIVYEAVLSIHL